MNVPELAVNSVAQLLSYEGPGFVEGRPSATLPGLRDEVWTEARERVGVDAAYFQGDVPLVYFRGLRTATDDQLAELHLRVWNHGRAPLLIVVLPQEVRVFNCLARPRTEGIVLARVENNANLNTQLRAFSRFELESGRLARRRLLSRTAQRVDRLLLSNLRTIRRQLVSAGLAESVVNTLLGRSIFVRYLEDRGVLRGAVADRKISSLTYVEVLERSLSDTYRLFEVLRGRFNGGVFPVSTEETASVEAQHLRLLAAFLRGDNVGSGQMSFWPYRFDVIPTELLSNVYEEFLRPVRKVTAAYYTPPHLADFVLDELLPVPAPENHEPVRPTVLDPACGSGVFLAKAYRRLIHRERLTKGRELTFEELTDILTESIFGADLTMEAVHVAAFSCYLVMMDYLTAPEISSRVIFPVLVGGNLLVGDFFDLSTALSDLHFDVVASNPPWASKLPGRAKEFLRQRRYPVGDEQLAQAFLWRAAELLQPGGRLGMLLPSKPTLYNKSRPNLAFRARLLQEHRVDAVVDFSAFRRRLFLNATGPMTAVFLTRRLPDEEATPHDVLFGTPHPSPFSESVTGVVLAGDELNVLSGSQAIRWPGFWKASLWGTPRDAALVFRLQQRFPCLSDALGALSLQIHQGFQRAGGGENEAEFLSTMRYIPADSITSFKTNGDPALRAGPGPYHRPRTRDVYQAPLVLVRRGLFDRGRIGAVYLTADAAYEDGVIGISRQPKRVNPEVAVSQDLALKALCAVLNSSFARYYYFLSASSWGVERDKIELSDHLSLPVPFLEEAGVAASLAEQTEAWQTQALPDEWLENLDRRVYAAYGIGEREQDLIRTLLDTTVEQFHMGMGSTAFVEPSATELDAYARTFSQRLSEALGGMEVSYRATADDSPYATVVVGVGVSDLSVVIPDLANVGDVLQAIEGVLERYETGRTVFRRNVRALDGRLVYIAKPMERRNWTFSAALRDADEALIGYANASGQLASAGAKA